MIEPADKYVEGLNPPQKAAVENINGPLMVLAGAGSGKTRVLTRRLANIVASGVPPYRIVAVTFTNKAAAEMRERVVELIGPRRDLWVGTFHSISARLLRLYGDQIGLSRDFVIYDADDQKALIRKLLKEWNLTHDAKDVRATVSVLEAYRGKRVDKLFGPQSGIHDEYMKRLAACNAVDFTGLIEKVAELSDILPKLWDYVLVDEFQDTSRLQFAMLRAMVSERRNICVVGDDDQSIYSWRGANPEYLLRFEKEFPGTQVIRLEQNYRSTGNIISAASALIANNLTRHGKTLWTAADAGVPLRFCVYERERDEARTIVASMEQRKAGTPLSQMAVLYRVNAQSRPFEEELRRAQIPYRLVGGTRFYERAEIKDVLSYLRLAVNSSSDLDFLRAIKTPSRGIGAVSLDKLAAQAKEKELSLWDLCAGGTFEVASMARKGLADFIGLIRELQEQVGIMAPHDLLELLLERTDVMGFLHSSGDEDLGRKENIDELHKSMQEFAVDRPDAVLRDWLDNVSLLTNDEQVDGEDGVTLMTIHSSKGLEFDVVFLPGWEEGLFPLRRADEEANIEEERRLAYVAITRARKEVHLSRTRTRLMYGNVLRTEASRFLHELPRECISIDTPSPLAPAFGGGGQTSNFSGGRRFRDADDDDDDEPVQRPRFGAQPQESSFMQAASRQPAPRPSAPGTLGAAAAAAASPAAASPAGRKAPAPSDGFSAGKRVRHAKFGEGVVKAVVGEGDLRKAMVSFGGAPPKVIMVSFLTLL